MIPNTGTREPGRPGKKGEIHLLLDAVGGQDDTIVSVQSLD
jgi:hypothetical protein